MIRFIYIVVFLLVLHSVNSQGGFRARIYTPSGLQHNTKDVFETSPGNYIATGLSLEIINGNYCSQFKIMGLNSNGQLQWTKTYGSLNLQFLEAPYASPYFYKSNTDIYYSGCMRDSLQHQIGTLVKFDFNGNKIWQKFYRDTLGYFLLQKVSASVDNGFLIAGMISLSSDTTIGLLIKTDAQGNELWRKKINKPSPNLHDYRSVIQDSATKKIMLLGNVALGTLASYNYYQTISVLDSLGAPVTEVYFTKGALEDIIQTKDKKFVTVGFLSFPGFHSLHSAAIYKFDINNPSHPIWFNNNFGPLVIANGFSSLKELTNGDIIVAGTVDSLSDYSNNVSPVFNTLSRFIIFNSITGQVKSTKYYNYAKNDTTEYSSSIVNICLTQDGGWITANRLSNFGNNSFFYVKYDSTGCDTTTAYCLNPVAIKQFSVQNLGLHIYPNPSTGILNIELNATLEKPLSISIRDALGRTVKQLSLSASTKIDLSDVKEGIYFLQVWEDGRLVASEKLVRE
jgi:hypothetical protein